MSAFHKGNTFSAFMGCDGDLEGKARFMREVVRRFDRDSDMEEMRFYQEKHMTSVLRALCVMRILSTPLDCFITLFTSGRHEALDRWSLGFDMLGFLRKKISTAEIMILLNEAPLQGII